MDTISIFEHIVKMVRQMLDDRQIRTFITPSGKPKFVIQNNDPIKQLAKDLEIKVSQIHGIIDVELPQLVRIALGSKSMELTTFNMFNFVENESLGKEIDEKTKRRIFKQKIQIVEELLITPELKVSFLIKSTAKGNCLTGVDWEINQKIFDDVEGKLPSLKYSIVRFRTSQFDENQNIFGSLFGTQESNTTFNFDLSDVDYLIDMLSSIKSALTKEG